MESSMMRLKTLSPMMRTSRLDSTLCKSSNKDLKWASRFPGFLLEACKEPVMEQLKPERALGLELLRLTRISQKLED